MTRANAVTETDGIAVKRADEALQALHDLRLDLKHRGYVRDDDLELLSGIQYNLGAVLDLCRRYMKTVSENGRNGH